MQRCGRGIKHSLYAEQGTYHMVREEDSYRGEAGDMAVAFEGARCRWFLKSSWDFGLHSAHNGKTTITVTPRTPFNSYLCDLICVIRALISLKAICR